MTRIVQSEHTVQTRRRGLFEITAAVRDYVHASGVAQGIATVFCPHTSCSLVLMENASPDAARDLERFFDRLAPERPDYEHSQEGPDDMPSHIKMALTRSSETIPIVEGRLALGTWQGVFLWEHRTMPHRRTLRIVVMGE